MSTSGAKHDETKPVDHADESPALAVSVGYQTTIQPCVKGEQQEAEVLNLFEHRGKSMKALHPATLLSGASDSKWRPVGAELGALSQLARVCGIVAASSVQRRGQAPGHSRAVLVPTGWYPVEDELEADEEIEASYAVSASVSSCALWNLLNNQSEEDMPSSW